MGERTPGPSGTGPVYFNWAFDMRPIVAALTPGPSGVNDAGDPNAVSVADRNCMPSGQCYPAGSEYFIPAGATATTMGLLREIMDEKHVPGNYAPFLTKVAGKINQAGDAFSFLDLVGLVAEGTVVEAAATVTGVASVTLFPVVAFIDVANTMSTQERMWVYRAGAYAATAWAYLDHPPDYSRKTLTRFAGGSEPIDEGHYIALWDEIANNVCIRGLDQALGTYEDRRALRMLLVYASDGDRATLSKELMIGFEDDVATALNRHIVLPNWRDGYDTLYPE